MTWLPFCLMTVQPSSSYSLTMSFPLIGMIGDYLSRIIPTIDGHSKPTIVGQAFQVFSGSHGRLVASAIRVASESQSRRGNPPRIREIPILLSKDSTHCRR